MQYGKIYQSEISDMLYLALSSNNDQHHLYNLETNVIIRISSSVEYNFKLTSRKWDTAKFAELADKYPELFI
jgi:hypothetical protein